MSDPNTAPAPNRMIPLVLFSAFMVMQANFLVLPSLAIFISDDLALSNAQISSFLATFSIVVLLSNLGWSRVLDRFNRKSVLFTGSVLVAAIFFLTAFMSNYEGLLFARVLMGLVMPMIGASVLPFIADIYAPQERPKIMGYVMSASYMVSLAVIPLVIMASELTSWRFAAIGIAAFTAGVAAFAYFILPRPEGAKPKAAKAGPGFNAFAPENRDTLSRLIGKFLQTAGIFTLFAVYPTWLASDASGGSFSSATMALIFFVAGGCGFLGSIASGRANAQVQKITDRLDPLMILSVICALFCLLVPIFGKSAVVLQHLSYAPMIFFQSIAVVLLMNTLISPVPATARGYINAMSNIVFQAGIAFGSFVGFLLHDHVSMLAVGLVAGVLIAASALSFFSSGRAREETA
ncbi:MFS transporter [Actibacterium lipolyticum]|uniref:Hexuronate transporter n=1 Tax=Actibacterium lipolyticum TaxID=1524263 RepID=A0A238L7Y5_9RHOB|nr:MFS transporter [Actibacterium lipolyticum]SMX51194.1 Hexuronate transporter [Actibacterium lipolyticum]